MWEANDRDPLYQGSSKCTDSGQFRAHPDRFNDLQFRVVDLLGDNEFTLFDKGEI